MNAQESRKAFEQLKGIATDALLEMCFDYLPYDRRAEVVEHLAYELGIDLDENE